MGLTHGGFDWDLHPQERHAAAQLAAYGYETHLCGLQHVTQNVDRLGFQYLHAQGAGHGGGARSAGAPDVAAAVEAFLRGARPRVPLYGEINFFEPHRPYDFRGVTPDSTAGVVVPPYLPQSAQARAELAALQGASRAVDQAVGRVLDALERAGLAQRALIIFSADHGVAMPRAKCHMLCVTGRNPRV